MLSMIMALTIAASVAILIAGISAAAARSLTKNNRLAVFIGGMTLPSLMVLGLAYWLMTMEVDDAPPGMVILGNLAALLVIIPVSFSASFFTVRALARTARSDVR